MVVNAVGQESERVWGAAEEGEMSRETCMGDPDRKHDSMSQPAVCMRSSPQELTYMCSTYLAVPLPTLWHDAGLLLSRSS